MDPETDIKHQFLAQKSLDPETDKMDQFLAPETDTKRQFLEPETDVKCQFLLLGPETDILCQFLEPETDIMGERNFMNVIYIKIARSAMGALAHVTDSEGKVCTLSPLRSS